MIPLYVFDLDGTLSDTRHRKHLIECEKPDWDLFYRESAHDAPVAKLIDLFDLIRHEGNDTRIVTGRSDAVRDITEKWLMRYTSMRSWEMREGLVMREHGDHTPDHEYKEKWLAALSEYDRRRLRMVFEDRTRVVQMWRRNDVLCCQVTDGDF
jgi:phosphoglycolate phosphatase-like HAD superfamily hydrolase